MPVKRYRKSMLRRRGRRMRRRFARKRVIRPRRHLYSFKRSFEGTAITLAATPVAGGLTFQLDQLPNYTEFENLFDQYRLNGVKISILPQFNSNDFNPQTTTLNVGRIYSCLDYNDSTAPATLNEVLEYQSMKNSPIWKGHSRFFKPAVPQIYHTPAGGGTDLTNPKYSPWIATINHAVPHYAVKFWIDGVTGLTEENIELKVLVTFYFQCKMVI